MDFKYRLSFEGKAKVKKGNFSKAKNDTAILAKANLQNLRGLLPDEEIIKDNYDLLYTAFNAAVVNLINENGHGIGTEAALNVSRYFVDRHLNLEHDRYSVIGHIISYGFSQFGNSEILEESDITGDQPFNICLGGIVYKCVREWIADLLRESSDPDSYMFEEISTSWEIGFNEYDIVLGSKKIADAKIISDPEQVREYSKYLRMEGGEGHTEDGTPVYCLIKGDARPLGCAFTGNPAAAVKGILALDINSFEPEEERANASKNEGIAAISNKLEEIDKNLKELNKNNSHKEKVTVNKSNMKLKQIDDITPDFLKEAEASDVRDFIKVELNKSSQEYLEKVQKAEDAKKAIEDSLALASEELEKLKKELEAAKAESDTLKGEIEEKEKQETFNIRMDEVSAAYVLDEKQTQIIASKLKGLDDKGYADYKAELELFAKKKEEVSSEDALRNAKASGPSIPNASPVQENQTELQKLIASVAKSFTSKN